MGNFDNTFRKWAKKGVCTMIFELGHDPRLQYSQGEMKKGVENVFITKRSNSSFWVRLLHFLIYLIDVLIWFDSDV